MPGAYLHAKMPPDKQIIMKLKGEFVKIMCEVNPEFSKHVTSEKGERVLYMRVLRAIYGCIESVLLWYNLFAGRTLEGMGFKINLYDRCVANKIINGKQCTITWYVVDNKVSHMEHRVNMEIIKKIKEHFGELTVMTGDVHDFLGMTICFNRENGMMSLDMKDQIKEAIEMFGEKLGKAVVNPAAKKYGIMDKLLFRRRI